MGEKKTLNKKTRRSQKKKDDPKCSMVIGINVNGLTGKKDSMITNIEVLIFENIRKNNGGSILTGAHSDLNPVLISDGSEDDTEVLVIEGELGGKKCRFINGYGPQEYADVDTRIKFFARIEEEVVIAKI